MALLFNIQEKVVYPFPEILMIDPFKTIWNRDTSEEKEVALQEFAYIEFMSSALSTNPYKDYDEAVKHQKIAGDIMKDENYRPDSYVKEGIQYWVKFQTEGSATYDYYMSAKETLENLKRELRTMKITTLNEKTGNPLYKPSDITRALKDTEAVATNLNKLKKMVEEEVFETTKNRADKKISPFADPKSLKS